MEILDAVWFTPPGAVIGIVLIENGVGQRKAYIGLGQGVDEEIDSKHIVEHGSPVDLNLLKRIIVRVGKQTEFQTPA